MAELEFKYLNEIEISDSLTDAAHVIVEDGGNIRRAPMNQLVTGGGVSSWNDLTDKPFYEESVTLDIHWDGEIGDRVSVDMDGTYLVHVSDYVLTDELVGTTMCYTSTDENGVTAEESVVLEAGDIWPYGNITMIYSGCAAVVPHDNTNFMGILFPKAGIYFNKTQELVTTSLTGEATIVNMLDNKYVDSHDSVTLNLSYTYDESTGSYNNITSDLGFADVLDAWKHGQGIYICIPTNDGMSYRTPAKVMAYKMGDGEQELIYGFYLLYSNLNGDSMMLFIMFTNEIDIDADLGHRSCQEMVAECIKILHCAEDGPMTSRRSRYLMEHFPKTIAMVGQILDKQLEEYLAD